MSRTPRGRRLSNFLAVTTLRSRLSWTSWRRKKAQKTLAKASRREELLVRLLQQQREEVQRLAMHLHPLLLAEPQPQPEPPAPLTLVRPRLPGPTRPPLTQQEELEKPEPPEQWLARELGLPPPES